MQSGAFKHIIVENTAVATIIQFKDQYLSDGECIQGLGEEISAVQDESNVPLILDFRDVEHLHPTTLGKFITLDRRAKGQGKKLIFATITPKISELFRITQLNKRLEIHDDLESALASLPEPS